VTIDATFRLTVGTVTVSAELAVDDREMLAIVGPNGAGKTTLLRALAGLAPIDDGRISIDGDVVDEPATGRFTPPNRRPVGLVFQDYLLFTHLSVRDNVAYGLRAHGERKAEARRHAEMILEHLGMADKARARPHELSGGQAQRVALARALAIEPSLMLLDEPLAALDVRTRADTRKHLRDTLAEFSGARVLVTHDPVDAFTLADRLLILENGSVTQTGTVDDIVNRPQSEYVAELIGVNFYRGRADGDRVTIGNAAITTAEPHDGDVVVTISPTAVALHPSRPDGSARNTMVGTVAAIEHLAHRVRVRVAGPLTMVAEITPAALQTLHLTEGDTIWTAVKATEIHVHTL
jgi:molybdate transport system ATP-binding protein